MIQDHDDDIGKADLEFVLSTIALLGLLVAILVGTKGSPLHVGRTHEATLLCL